MTEEIFIEAVDYFGSKEAALQWFKTPILALGGQSPAEYCKVHQGGDKKVLELLNKLKNGMTA